MGPMTTKTPQQLLAELGFRYTNDFQAAVNLPGHQLVVDGVFGPKTTSAALTVLQRRASHLPDLSAHFSVREFTCECGGRYSGCHLTRARRELLASLETYRTRHGDRPVEIRSGYRCVQRNREVGGATSSQHLSGAAADLAPIFAHEVVVGWHLFAGIGYGSQSGMVVHVDRRDLTGSGSTPAHPAVFVDGR